MPSLQGYSKAEMRTRFRHADLTNSGAPRSHPHDPAAAQTTARPPLRAQVHPPDRSLLARATGELSIPQMGEVLKELKELEAKNALEGQKQRAPPPDDGAPAPTRGAAPAPAVAHQPLLSAARAAAAAPASALEGPSLRDEITARTRRSSKE